MGAEMRAAARAAKFKTDPLTGKPIKYSNTHLSGGPTIIDKGIKNMTQEDIRRHHETDIGVRKQQEKMKKKKEESTLDLDEMVDLAQIRMKLEKLGNTNEERAHAKKDKGERSATGLRYSKVIKASALKGLQEKAKKLKKSSF